ncbi:MAG: helix-turn-helix domain-containing protein [Fidelibacterota bacterium]
MSFYTDLKKTRREKEIDLSEITNRTKINQAYLESIEKGEFTFLPHVYVRLFLRAYAIEIGIDPDETVNQMEIFLTKEQITPPEQLTIDDTMKEDHLEDYLEPAKSPLESRKDFIKVAILVAIFIFAIFIIKQITANKKGVEEHFPTTLSQPEKQSSYSKGSTTSNPQVEGEISLPSEEELTEQPSTDTPSKE